VTRLAHGFKARFILILLAATGLYLIGNASVCLWDRDEPRYAQCSREMLQSGDWVVPTQLRWAMPTVHDSWRLEKPPVIYWLQASAMKIIGDNDFAARLPSALATLATAAILGLLVRYYAGEKRALWSMLIFCSAGVVIAAAKMCITDATLMFFVAVGQMCLGIMWASARRNRANPWIIAPLFWISLGLAGLTKGPQAIGFHAVTLLALLVLDLEGNFRSAAAWKNAIRWWRRLQPVMGIALLASVTMPWVVLIHVRAPGFLAELFHKVQMHTSGSMEGHGAPPGYHALLIFGTFFPWSLLLPTAITLAYMHRKSPVVRFAIAAFVGPWLLMELVTTKLPFYVLPAFPALSFLTADALVRCIRAQHRDLRKPAFAIAAVVWALASIGIGLSPWLTKGFTTHLPVVAISIFTIGCAVYGVAVPILILRRRFAATALVMGIGMMLMVGWLFGGLLPRLDFLRMSQRLANDMKSHGVYGPQPMVPMIYVTQPNGDVLGYQEDSLPWYEGGGMRALELGTILDDQQKGIWPQSLVVAEDVWTLAPPSLKIHYQELNRQTGMDYARNGKINTLLFMRRVDFKP